MFMILKVLKIFFTQQHFPTIPYNCPLNQLLLEAIYGNQRPTMINLLSSEVSIQNGHCCSKYDLNFKYSTLKWLIINTRILLLLLLWHVGLSAVQLPEGWQIVLVGPTRWQHWSQVKLAEVRARYLPLRSVWLYVTCPFLILSGGQVSKVTFVVILIRKAYLEILRCDINMPLSISNCEH